MAYPHRKLGTEFTPSSEPFRNDFSDLEKELHKQSQEPPSGDPVIAAFCGALHESLIEDPKVKDALVDILALRKSITPDLGASQLAGIIRSAIITDHLMQGEEPQKWTHSTRWRQPIKDSLLFASNDSPTLEHSRRWDELTFNLVARLVQTNPPSRAIGDELLMQSLWGSRFMERYHWLDIGSGLLEIPNQILHKEQYPFDCLKFASVLGGTALRKTTACANELLARPHLIDSCLAVDIMDPRRDTSAMQWSRGSLRPQAELDNPTFMDKFEGLASSESELLSFFEGDLSTPEGITLFKEMYPGFKVDIATLSTVTHQLKPKRRVEMLRTANSLLDDDGLLVVKDFAFTQANQPGSLRFYKHWHLPGRYAMYVFDKQYPERGFQQLYVSRDSRNLEIANGVGSILVQKEEYSFSELIENAIRNDS